MKILQNKLWGIGLVLSLLSSVVLANGGGGGESAPKKSKRQEPFQIKAAVWGPATAEVEAAKRRVERSDAVRRELGGAKYRLLSLEYIDHEVNGKFLPPTRFRVTFYDYTNDRTVVAESSFDGREAVSVRRAAESETAARPFPSVEEIEDAIRLVGRDERYTAAVKSQKLRPYPAMPPITVTESGERLINIGLESFDSSAANEVVSVSFKRGEVVRYDKGAPPQSKAAPESCGIPTAGQVSNPRGLPGQFDLTVTQGQTTLWEMTVIRPSSSSGPNGSGIDLLNVKYKGKSVLKRGHVPFLNVEYVNNVCGPFLDWQWQEGHFIAPAGGAQDPNGPNGGIRILAPGQIATTSIETGNDQGNFQGVAIYQQNVGLGNEVVMVTEMNAGWYRYIMEWRFAENGTIRPRFGFGSVNNQCVCSMHNHHVYWRFDFDVVQPANKIFQVERGRKFLRPVLTETGILRSYQTNRSFIVQNAAGNEAYMLIPNPTDGVADTYGRGDFWLLKTAPNNDELGLTGPGYTINMTPYLNNESLDNTDVTVWYAGHFIHEDGQNPLSRSRSGEVVLSGEYVVGPELRPIRW